MDIPIEHPHTLREHVGRRNGKNAASSDERFPHGGRGARTLFKARCVCLHVFFQIADEVPCTRTVTVCTVHDSTPEGLEAPVRDSVGLLDIMQERQRMYRGAEKDYLPARPVQGPEDRIFSE